MIRFFEIIKEEWNNFIHDSGATLVMVIGVIAYSLFYAMPYSTEVVKEVPIGVIDVDSTNLSRTFIRNLETSDSLKIVKTFVSKEDAEKDFYKNKIRAFVILPKDFEKDILKGKQSTVELFADSGFVIIYKAVFTGVSQTAAAMGAKIEIGKLLKQGVPKQLALTIKQPFEFVQIPLYNASGGYETYVYPSILVMILHQTLIAGLGLIQGTRNELREKYCEKEKDIPVFLFARCTTYVLLYLFYSLIIFLIFPVFCVYPMAYNIIPLFILLIIIFYSAAFFAHTLSYFFKTRETVFLIIVVTSLIFIFLPGFIWPKEAIPDWLNFIALFIPTTCGIDGIIKINQMGGTFWNIRNDVLWLMFLCAFYYFTSVYLLKKNFNYDEDNTKIL